MSSYDFKETCCRNGSIQLTLDFYVREVNHEEACQFTSIDCQRLNLKKSPRGTSTANFGTATIEKIIIHYRHEYQLTFRRSKTLKRAVLIEAVNAAGCVMPMTFLDEIQCCMDRNMTRRPQNER